MKGHNLMANHVATVLPYRLPQKSVPAYTIHIIGKEWAHANKITGEVTIQPDQINAVACPDTGNPQEYRHLMKGTEESKWTRAIAN